MRLIEIIKKQGGIKLLKQYWKGGAFFTSIGELMFLGKSRTALEILRLSAQLKTKQKLEKKYKACLNEFDRQYVVTKLKKAPEKIWVCWFQGMNNAPEIVKRCYQSIVDNLYRKEVVLITYENMYDFVSFPPDIQSKIDSGVIKGAHLSDLLRLRLLIEYGGTWIDATVLCTSKEIPEYMLSSDLFMFQNLKPGRDGHSMIVSSWFITSCSHNIVLEAVSYLLFKYWSDNNELVDYYIFHYFFQMAIEKYPEEWNKVIPFDNSIPHILLLRLFESYDSGVWNAVLNMSPFHKLSYKFTLGNIEKSGTYYKKIMGICMGGYQNGES